DRPFDVVRWRERASQMTDLSELRDDLERPLVVPSGAVAETWRDLLMFAFGLLDGSALPEGVDAEALDLDDRRLVVTNPGMIAPDPAHVPPVALDGAQPRACDPLHLRSIATVGEAGTTDGEPTPDPEGPR